jgi:hypothetical protein
MMHIGPDKLYEMLQSDIDWATKNDYQIFFEGVKKDPPREASTVNDGQIREFFMFLFDLFPVFATVLGISLQKEGIVYPKDSINADITFAEFTKQLDNNGFRCNFLRLPFTMFSKEELKKVMEKDLTKRGGLNALMDSLEKPSFSKLIAWFLLRKATPIILDYRNEVAVAKVRAHSNGHNVFIHYGEKHIRGIVSLLQKDGWVVKETTYTDLAKFC